MKNACKRDDGGGAGGRSPRPGTPPARGEPLERAAGQAPEAAPRRGKAGPPVMSCYPGRTGFQCEIRVRVTGALITNVPVTSVPPVAGWVPPRYGYSSATSRTGDKSNRRMLSFTAAEPVGNHIGVLRNLHSDYRSTGRTNPRPTHDHKLALSGRILFEIQPRLESLCSASQRMILQFSRSGQLSLHPEHG
jgi:hypothetical protein